MARWLSHRSHGRGRMAVRFSMVSPGGHRSANGGFGLGRATGVGAACPDSSAMSRPDPRQA